MPNLTMAGIKPSQVESALMKLWNSLMMLSTAILGFFVFVLKDESVLPSFALGILGLCLPPVVRLIRTINRRMELNRKNEEQKRIAEINRIKRAREREREMLEQEELYARKQAAENEAVKNILSNVNMAAFRPN